MEQNFANPNSFTENNKSFAAAVARQPPVRNVSLATPSTVSFNNVVNNSLRNQGIAFDSLEENASIEVYLDALCKIVPNNAVTHISRSSRMINVYFSSTTWANQLIRDGLDVKDFHLDVRPIATTPIKVIVSNVPPEIGHQFIRSEMNKYGRVVGPIKTLSAATSRPEYAHIRSFRSLVLVEFANDEAMNRLPKQMNFSLDGKPYSFYTSLDVKCFRCGKMGHLRKNCTETEPVSFTSPKVTVPKTTIIISETEPKESPSTVIPQNKSGTSIPNQELANSDSVKNVEELSLQILSEPTTTPVTTIERVTSPKTPKRKKKKLKRVASPPDEATTNAKVPATPHVLNHQLEDDTAPFLASSECEEMDSDSSLAFSDSLEPGLLDNFTHDSPLPIEILVSFLNEVKGSPHRLRIAKRFTDDILGLISQVKQLADYLKKCPIKSRNLSQPRVVRVFTGLNEEFNFSA